MRLLLASPCKYHVSRSVSMSSAPQKAQLPVPAGERGKGCPFNDSGVICGLNRGVDERWGSEPAYALQQVPTPWILLDE
jgi:hypothetical protein